MDRWWKKYGDAKKREIWEALSPRLYELLERQLIVSRFDMADLASPVLFQVIWRNVLESKKLLFGPFFPPRHKPHKEKTCRIRLVIDDLRVLCSICPDILADTAFLPFLTFQLERAGVTSLLVCTDAVRPDSKPDNPTSRALLSLLKRSLLVWNVPFEGRTRVAITVIPPTQDENNGIVRRLILNRPIKRWSWEPEPGKTLDRTPVPKVTPEFELYSGIEEGKPKPVPLSIYLNAETRQFQTYVDQEDSLFRELFTSVEGGSPVKPGRVIFPLDRTRYLAMRDYAHLASDSIDAHTMVFQIDGSWVQRGQGILQTQDDYLKARLSDSDALRKLQDPFNLFPISSDKRHRFQYFNNSQYRIRFRSCDRVPFTWDFGFMLVRSSPWEVFGDEKLQPMMGDPGKPRAGLPETGWPFDYMPLIRKVVPFKDTPDSKGAAENDAVLNRVKDVYSQLSVGGEREVDRGECLSWRKFFGACRTVADMHSEQTGAAAVAFDISASSPETINTLILEIWFSEMLIEGELRKVKLNVIADLPQWKTLSDKVELPQVSPLTELLTNGIKPEEGSVRNTFDWFVLKWDEECRAAFEQTSGRVMVSSGSQLTAKRHDQLKTGERELFAKKGGPDRIAELFNHLPLASFCLYKTWLLLLEVLDFDSFLDPENPFAFIEGRSASLQSMASRHWYKTACTFGAEMYRTEGIHDSPTALRLPGSFSARGDWFLGSPAKSRSRLLARQAFDLLCSRRGNLSRMQFGLGLPVRDVLLNSIEEDQLRTALRCRMTKPRESRRSEGDQPSRQLTYKELASLGERKDAEFYWLWRSTIPDYDRQSRALQKWTARLFRWTIELRKHLSRNWNYGFEAYDALTCRKFSVVRSYPSFLEFADQCDLLIAELNAAAPSDNTHNRAGRDHRKTGQP